MSEPRPFASLTSSLLARKGFARPAMRPQGHSLALSPAGDDLGWNDMGLFEGDLTEPDELPDTPKTPTSAYLTPLPQADAPAAVEAPLPVVLQQQADIAQGLGIIAEGAPAKLPRTTGRKTKANGKNGVGKNGKAMAVPTPRITREPGSRAKAAFTLRLDAERHLRLRLASAIGHRSAQKLLIEALDAYLATVPGLDELASSAASGGSAA